MMTLLSSLVTGFKTEFVLILGLVALIVTSLIKVKKEGVAEMISFTTLFLALCAALCTASNHYGLYFSGEFAFDKFGQFFKIIILLTALGTVILSYFSRDLVKVPKIEFQAFLISLALGLLLMSSANDLLMIYLSIEMASIVSYVMAGYLAGDLRSEESGLKYVLYGGVASGIMIFGMSLLYGLTGTLNLSEIREFLIHNPTDRLVLFITFIFILAGLGYKMAVAPFHMWSPDVYEGAPLPVTAFLSVASKTAGFAVTLRFFLVGFIDSSTETWTVLKTLDWQFLIATLSAITMTVGNILALQQKNIKRFLAYSSVAHAGYLLMGVAAQSKSGIESIQIYTLIYLLMNMGAFFVASLVANQFNTENMDDYKGLAKQGAFGFFLAVSLSIFLFSLTGIPPFAGFIGKWYLFKAVVEAKIYWLAVVAGLNSVVALFYYLRLAKYMLIDDKTKEFAFTNSWIFKTTIALCATLTVVFGIYFAPLAKWVAASSVFIGK